MRLSAILGFSYTAVSCVSAYYHTVAYDQAKHELTALVEQLFEERLEAQEAQDIKNVFHKRDTTTDTLVNILNLVNDSDIIWGILDQIAYNPQRIELLANATANIVGDVNLTSVKDMTSNLNLNLNYSKIYKSVADSGVVTSLLDGILLDEDYRPVLSGLVSRVLGGSKNLFNYLVKHVFRSSQKRDLAKRDNGGTLEIFVGNIISSALSSSLVGGIANDVLVALNETQFLTDTVKRFLADEGYQNMTLQFAIDFINTGKVKIDTQAVNITSIVDKALSKPTVIINLVSNLLSGNVKFASLGKYNDAVSAIIKQVEDDGTFAELNEYVFSETHSVTSPLVPTNDIVVPRTTSTSTTRTTSSTGRPRSASNGTFTVEIDVSALSEYGAGVWSSATTTSRSGSSRTGSSSRTSAVDSSAAEVDSILSLLRASSADFGDDTETETGSADTVDVTIGSDVDLSPPTTTGRNTRTTSSSRTASATATTLTTGSSQGRGILDILIGLDSSTSTAVRRRARALVQEGAGSSHKNHLTTKVIVCSCASFLGALLVL